MPRSNSQTSPLGGGILFLIQECEQRTTAFSNLLVRDRTGFNGQLSRSPEDFYRERLLVTGREGLEGVEEFDRLLTHIFKLTVSPTENHPPSLNHTLNMNPTEHQVLARMRKICLGLDGTEERLSHGHPTFATKKGIYAVLEEYRGELSICVKVGLEVQGLFLKDPRYYLTPYSGKHGWVSLKVHAAPLDWEEIGELLAGSHSLVNAPKPPRALRALRRSSPL